MDDTILPMEEIEPLLADNQDEPIVARDYIKERLAELKERRDSDSKEMCRRRREREVEAKKYGPVHHAAACGNTDVLKCLLEKNLVYTPAHDAPTPLHLASRYLQLECVNLLLEQGDIKVDAVDDNGLTPLHSAGMDASSHVEEDEEKPGSSMHIRPPGSAMPVVKLLIQKGAKLPEDDWRIMSNLIHAAVTRHDVDFLEHAMKNSWDILGLKNEQGYNVLHCVVTLKDLNILKMILSYRDLVKDVLNEPLPYGMSPLCEAASYGWVEGVRELLQAGAQLVGEGQGQMNVLHWAALGGSPEVIDMLLAEAAKNGNIIEIINTPCSTGESPIFLAVGSWNRQCVQKFIDWGADVTWKSEGNYNLIHRAMTRITDGEDGDSPADMLLHLLEYPELNLVVNDVTTKSTDGGVFGSPVNIAAWWGNLDCVTVLVENYEVDFTKPFVTDCSIDRIKGGDWTPLHSAAFKGNLQIIQYIVKKDIETLRAITVDGWTPLHVATWNRQEESVQCLLKLGASLVETTRDSTSALEIILDRFSDPQKLMMDIFDACILDSDHANARFVRINFDAVLPYDVNNYFAVLTNIHNYKECPEKIDKDALYLHPLMKTLEMFKIEEMCRIMYIIIFIYIILTLGFYLMTVSWQNYDSTPFIDVIGLVLLGFWMCFSLDLYLVTEDWRRLFRRKTGLWFLWLLMAMVMTISHLTSPCCLPDYSTWVLVPMVFMAIGKAYYCVNPNRANVIGTIINIYLWHLIVHGGAAFLFMVGYMYASNKNHPLNDSWKIMANLLQWANDYQAKAVSKYIGEDVTQILNGLYVLVPLLTMYFLRKKIIFGVSMKRIIERRLKLDYMERVLKRAKIVERISNFWFHNISVNAINNSDILYQLTTYREITVYHSKQTNSLLYSCRPISYHIWECVADWYFKQEDPVREKDKDLFLQAKGIKPSIDCKCPCLKGSK